MDKKIYRVTFKYSESVFCSNVVIADDVEQVASHYRKYSSVYIEEGNAHDVEDAKRRGKPIVRL